MSASKENICPRTNATGFATGKATAGSLVSSANEKADSEKTGSEKSSAAAVTAVTNKNADSFGFLTAAAAIAAIDSEVFIPETTEKTADSEKTLAAATAAADTGTGVPTGFVTAGFLTDSDIIEQTAQLKIKQLVKPVPIVNPYLRKLPVRAAVSTNSIPKPKPIPKPIRTRAACVPTFTIPKPKPIRMPAKSKTVPVNSKEIVTDLSQLDNLATVAATAEQATENMGIQSQKRTTGSRTIRKRPEYQYKSVKTVTTDTVAFKQKNKESTEKKQVQIQTCKETSSFRSKSAKMLLLLLRIVQFVMQWRII